MINPKREESKMNINKLYLLSFFAIQILFAYNSCLAQEYHGGISLPAYSGGFSALKEFIMNNIQLKEETLKEGIPAVVTVSYTVTEEGNIENIRILRGINAECDSEAVRVTRLITGWQPALRWGKPISVRIVMPLELYIQGNETQEDTVIVSGKITDRATGNPIVGSLILAKGTSIGAITDKDGFYQISIPGEEFELEYSAIAYEIKSEKIGKNRTINVELIPEDFIVDFSSDQLK